MTKKTESMPGIKLTLLIVVKEKQKITLLVKLGKTELSFQKFMARIWATLTLMEKDFGTSDKCITMRLYVQT